MHHYQLTGCTCDYNECALTLLEQSHQSMIPVVAMYVNVNSNLR